MKWIQAIEAWFGKQTQNSQANPHSLTHKKRCEINQWVKKIKTNFQTKSWSSLKPVLWIRIRRNVQLVSCLSKWLLYLRMYVFLTYTCFKYIFYEKFQYFVTLKSDQDQDPDVYALVWRPGIGSLLRQKKTWIRIHIETNGYPQHWLKQDADPEILFNSKLLLND